MLQHASLVKVYCSARRSGRLWGRIYTRNFGDGALQTNDETLANLNGSGRGHVAVNVAAIIVWPHISIGDGQRAEVEVIAEAAAQVCEAHPSLCGARTRAFLRVVVPGVEVWRKQE